MNLDRVNAIKMLAEQGKTPEAIANDSSWGQGAAPSIAEIKSALAIRRVTRRPGDEISMNTLLTLGNETRSVIEWARLKGFGRNTIWQRLKAGWSVEDALTIPMKKQRNNKPVS